MALEKELGQEEIDALFQAARAQTQAAPEPARSRVLPWSFSRSGQISNEQLRAISMLNDIFARNLTHHLGAWFRSRVKVSLVSAEQCQRQRISAACSRTGLRLLGAPRAVARGFCTADGSDHRTLDD